MLQLTSKLLAHYSPKDESNNKSLMCYFFCGTLDATLEGSSMGYLSLPYSPEPVVFPGVIHVSDRKVSHESHAVVSRRKRNILFPSGVKLCAQETAPQVVANHLSFFHLRGKTEHKRE